ncbi:hypothetical protein LCGC14_2602850, partial [marine sediment metagenome]
LKLAQEIEHTFYVRKFNEMLSMLEEDFEEFSLEKYQELPIEEALKDEIEMLKMNIKSISNGHRKKVYTVALNDLDPTDFLKSCKYLAIKYNPSPVGISMVLYSIGGKIVMCLNKEKYSSSANLSSLRKYFEDKICYNCVFEWINNSNKTLSEIRGIMEKMKEEIKENKEKWDKKEN